MTTVRIHLPKDMNVGDRCVLTDENRQYVTNVLRLRRGDKVLIFDGLGHEYGAIILDDRQRVSVEILNKMLIQGTGACISLAQSLPKGKKMDFIIEKATELGACAILPFVSERSVPRLDKEKSKLRKERWQKISREAARKSRSPGIPEIKEIMTLEEMLRQADADALKIIFWEEENRMDLKFALTQESLAGRQIFLVVGPEGGFSPREIALAQSHGFTSVSLGRQILKVETAALAIMAIIQYEGGSLDTSKKGGICL